MNIMLTGITGTLAPFVFKELEANGHQVTLWKRDDVNIENREEIKKYIEKYHPDYFIHIATGSESWLEAILDTLVNLKIPLLWTSSEAIFGAHQTGPFNVDSLPEPSDEYGKYKRRLEEMVMLKYPEKSHIVRLGWQIGETPEKNNMLAYLVQEKNIEASTNWILATSFMKDTAKSLVKLLDSTDFGICHLDSNQDDLSFYEIVMGLKEMYNLPINITKKSEPIRNNRLVTKRGSIASISDRLYLQKK